MQFTHLHVASSFSLRYGTTPPKRLVERAHELGYERLALTDRDGLYGVVKFVEACRDHDIEPVVGVDLALEPPTPTISSRPRRTPAKGGAAVDDRGPRVTVLARGAASGLAKGVGWGQLCRLVTDAHLVGERSAARTSRERIARFVTVEEAGRGNSAPALTVLLGPASDVGQALLAERPAAAEQLLKQWRAALPHGALAVEVACHDGAPGTPASRRHALDLWALARACGVPAVLTGWVRHADADEAVTADLLDAARRMVALDLRHLDRTSTRGHLLPESEMLEIARELAQAAGDESAALDLVGATSRLAELCVQHPFHDIGIGAVHLPEPEVLDLDGVDPQRALAERCRAALPARYGHLSATEYAAVEERLDDELEVVRHLGYPTYFLTVAIVCDLIRDAGVRVAARGSGAGSLINYLLGISGVDPIRHRLLMERFCTPLRASLPDIDIDVESARRTEMYERIMERFGGERVTCVSMAETYRVRHAIRDAGAALGMPPVDVDVIAKAFPHIAARNARQAIEELPELRARGLASSELERLFDLVERLDGLPRHVALHPCGVVLSNAQLGHRTPMEASWLGFPMSQFDKDDVETLGLLKLDVLGIRMQSAMAHAVAEIERVEGVVVDLDDETCVPFDDEATFDLIRSTRTLGCFQIESPGQRELIGKFAPEAFEDLIIDISLFRPGPVKSDMITPFLRVRQGWGEPEYLHESLRPALEETVGVVVFHEQVLRIVAETTGVTLAQADEVRRAMGSPTGQEKIEQWWRSAAKARGYTRGERERIWAVLAAFASFGFCKAHAAAFALPTYQSAWLKTHHLAAFVAGVLTHDPGMYPKRLILADARTFGVPVLGVDINASRGEYRVERVSGSAEEGSDNDAGASVGLPDGPGSDEPDPSAEASEKLGLRIGFADVKGMSEREIETLVAAQPYSSLSDVWNRAGLTRTSVERLVLVGAFDSLYGFGARTGRGALTRRDLLLELEDLERWHLRGTSRGRPRGQKVLATKPSSSNADERSESSPGAGEAPGEAGLFTFDPVEAARAQAQGRRPGAKDPVGAQLVLDLVDGAVDGEGSGLPEFTPAEKVRAELDILGLDVSGHVMEFYAPMLRHLGLSAASDLVNLRGGQEVWCAGIKVATQTPPVRSGRRVIFLTLDDGTGPADATFFEDVQGPYADTVFHSWMLLVRGVVRRTGPHGVSIRATGAWDLTAVWQAWSEAGADGVSSLVGVAPPEAEGDGGARGRRMLVHSSGFKQSPYADIKPAGETVSGGRAQLPGQGEAPRSLWHASPGSSGGWGR